MVWASTANGRIQAGNVDKVYVPYGWRYNHSRRLVIWLHGSGSTYRPGPHERWMMDRLGVPWICSDLGGTETWMGAAMDTALTNVWTWAKNNLLIKPDKVVLWGGSMGGGNALEYALDHPNDVAAVGAAIPALDPEFVRANNVAGKKAAIEAVHGANVVPVNKQPKLRGAEWDTDIGGHLWYSTNDGYTPAASVEQFAADSGIEITSMGGVGHSYTSIYATKPPLDFLAEYV